jgi:peptide/nickel transport system substrate-binding protein
VPKYGGTLTQAIAADPTYFDSGSNKVGGGALLDTVYEQWVGGDWQRGPAGSDVNNIASGAQVLEDNAGPGLAESWKAPDQSTWVMTIRKGVRWQNPSTDAGKLVNGREMTTDDVLSSVNRLLVPGTGWMSVSQPAAQKATTASKTGPQEITIKTTPEFAMTVFTWIIQGAGYNRVYPPEVIAKYGDIGNWRNAVGTGPFILTDFVPGSQLIFVRNPNYWRTDPVGPGKGNQLPYVSNYRELIIPDLSTRQAALRTGKIDSLTAFTKTDFDKMIQGNSKLQSVKYLSGQPWALAMNITQKNKPWSDLRVRQAMMYATDFDAWKKDYFGGDAEIDVWPVNKQTSAMYTPLSEMPQEVQDLYKYNPDKAKQLLKDAGYPNGFQASVVVSTTAERVDELSIFKSMWSKVGITLNIDTKETVTYNSISTARSNDELIYRLVWANFPQQLYFSPERGPSSNNPSFVNDPVGSIPEIEAVYQDVTANIVTNMPASYEAYKKLKPLMLGGAYYIVRPTPYTYSIWWPWLKSYFGTPPSSVYMKYAWVDQDLKKSMGY